MQECIFCRTKLDETTAPEHILLRSLGGRKITDSVICSECNNRFGSSIDKALSESVEVLRNIGDFKSGNGRKAPSIQKIESEGNTFRIEPGAVPIAHAKKKLRTKKLEDGTTEVSISANSEEEFVRLLEAATSKLNLSDAAGDKLKAEALKSAILRSTPSPKFEFNISIGDEDSQRSMAKSCLVLWASHVGSTEVNHPRYDNIRNFVYGNALADVNYDIITLNTRPLPPASLSYGPNPNIIWVGSDDTGSTVGHFRLFGAFGWNIMLCRENAPTNRTACVISDPETPSNWSDGYAATKIFNFDWVTEPNEEVDFSVVKHTLGLLLERSYERSRQNMISDIVDRAFRDAGVEDGQAVTETQWKAITRQIAWDSVHTLLKLPYSRPLRVKH